MHTIADAVMPACSVACPAPWALSLFLGGPRLVHWPLLWPDTPVSWLTRRGPFRSFYWSVRSVYRSRKGRYNLLNCLHPDGLYGQCVPHWFAAS